MQQVVQLQPDQGPVNLAQELHFYHYGLWYSFIHSLSVVTIVLSVHLHMPLEICFIITDVTFKIGPFVLTQD